MAASSVTATYYSQLKEDTASDKGDAGGIVAETLETLHSKQQQQLQSDFVDTYSDQHHDNNTQVAVVPKSTTTTTAVNKNVMLFRRFKDSAGVLRNFNSLPLFVYATSPCTRATSADGVGILKELTPTEKNMAYDLQLSSRNLILRGSTLDCLPLNGTDNNLGISNSAVGPSTTAIVVGGAGGVSYQHHLNIDLHQLANHHSPYSNNYPLHHSSSQHRMHSDQTKSLQELQHEVGALLEFRDLVIETFPDLKLKMASMTSSASSAAVSGSVSGSVSGAQAPAGGSSLNSRREWEPGIRMKRKLSHKEYSTVSSTSMAVVSGGSCTVPVGELSSLSRSRSNSHGGKKEPKSGENNNGSVIQDSGFSTETSSSKEGHSASSTNGTMTNTIALHRPPCLDADDELLNLLDVIHRKSNRLREEVEHLQNYERENLPKVAPVGEHFMALSSEVTATKSTTNDSCANALSPSTFRDHVERLNKKDIMQLRKERDKLLDKLAEMEAETLTGRIKTVQISDQVEELTSVKRDLEEQLKMAMTQKLELSSRIQQLQQQQQQSKTFLSQLDFSSQRNYSTPTTTVLTSGSGHSNADSVTTTVASPNRAFRPNTFQSVEVIDQQHQDQISSAEAFHQSGDSDSKNKKLSNHLGRLDGIVSTPGGRNSKCRNIDSERITAILLETNVYELQRHLLTLSVQNQILMQKLDQTIRSKMQLTKRLDKSKDDVEDLRFQLEEKIIELEGTKAQLRVLESRINVSTLSGGAANNSYMHSQNDYETNRSSASTTLMLSRRGFTGIDMLCNELSIGQMPQPAGTQISTPSMKAMVHLPMDELQHHSSSTESAHDHDLQHAECIETFLNSSVGLISPFKQNSQGTSSDSRAQISIRKVIGSAMSKPSKIPLPGSKSTSHCIGKPPTGRPHTAGRSPPSANMSSGSNASNRSVLSRSTGNLLYSKSPNSLKRNDSAQSMRKDNSSFSTNNSRSSTSSSIPMATSQYLGYKSSYGGLGAATPPPRLLQNSPLPKHKRESLTSRVRHLDSLSRAQQHYSHSNLSNDSECSSQSTTPASGLGLSKSTKAFAPTTSRNYLSTSTPKPSTIASQLNSTLRKDLQLNTNNFGTGSTQIMRRVTGNYNKGSTANAFSDTGISSSQAVVNTPTTISRRFSSASVIGSRGAMSARNQKEVNSGNVTGASDHHTANGVASDSDSGKKSINNMFNLQSCSKQYSNYSIYSNDNEIIINPEYSRHYNLLAQLSMLNIPNKLPLQHTKELFIAAIEEECEGSFNSDYSLSRSEHGSDNLLDTFEYDSYDSLEKEKEINPFKRRAIFMINEENTFIGNERKQERISLNAQNVLNKQSETTSDDDLTNPFKVHHMHHIFKENSLSLHSSYSEYDVDRITNFTCKGANVNSSSNFEQKFYNGIGFFK